MVLNALVAERQKQKATERKSKKVPFIDHLKHIKILSVISDTCASVLRQLGRVAR